jgi:hypothetical protein
VVRTGAGDVAVAAGDVVHLRPVGDQLGGCTKA